MIVAIEGPDCAGKSSLFGALKGRIAATFFRYPAVSRDDFTERITELEERDLYFWEQLYDPGRLYISDRFTAVSSMAYARMYGRRSVDCKPWVPELRVLYLRVPAVVLQARLARRGDAIQRPDLCSDAVASYNVVVQEFQHATLDGTLPTEVLAEQSLVLIDGWLLEEVKKYATDRTADCLQTKELFSRAPAFRSRPFGLGMVWSLLLKVEKLRSYIHGQLSCELGTKPTTPCIEVANDAVREHMAVARHGPRPEGAYLCHRCDNPLCVHPEHLFWGTAQDNVRDAAIKGRLLKGQSLRDLEAELFAACESLQNRT